MLRRLNETTNVQGMNLPGWGLHPLKGRELIPFPDHPCRLLHLLAVLKHCLRRRAYFTNDLEMESRGIFLFGSAAIGE